MMYFIYTLLTLAAGMLFGKAATFKTSKMWQKIVGLPILFCLCVIVAIWLDNLMHQNSLVPILNRIFNLGLMLYGVFLAVAFFRRKEILEEAKDAGKRSWIATASLIVIAKLPPLLFIIMLFFPWSAWEAAISAVGAGLIIAAVLWISFHFIWVLKYGFTTTAKLS